MSNPSWRCENAEGDVKFGAREDHKNKLEEQGYTCVLDAVPEFDEHDTMINTVPPQVVTEEPEPEVGDTLDPTTANEGAILSNGNLTLSEPGGDWMVNAATVTAKDTGNVYFEVEGSSPSDLWAEVGMVNVVAGLGDYPGLELGSWGIELGHWFNDDVYYHINGNGYAGFTTYIDGIAAGQISGFAVKLATGEVWYRLQHGTGWMGGGDPALGTNPSLVYPVVGPLRPSAGVYDATLTFNFGATPFAMDVPAGFVAWDSA